ncbi:hypothetical protein GCM10009603_30200 [Nocardiopsis exhalans]
MGLELSGLEVFTGVLGAVAAQAGQVLGTALSAGGVLTHPARGAFQGVAAREGREGAEVVGAAGPRDRVLHQILFPCI